MGARRVMETRRVTYSGSRALILYVSGAAFFLPAAAALVAVPDISLAQQSAGVEEIVVTAQRREQNLQDVPIAISAFTNDAIERSMFEDISDYITQTPNASFISSGARSRRKISIRGVTSFQGPGTTGFYVDGFSIANSTINPPIMDVKRIEILRGPQATYFGRNALGGGISITSNKPDNHLFSSIMMDYSRFNTIDMEGVLNVPIVEDRFAARFNLKHVESDGNIENMNPLGGGNDSKYQYARSSFRYTPTDRLTVDVMAMWGSEYVGMREGVPSGVFGTFAADVLYPGEFPDRDGDGLTDPFVDTVGFYPQNRDKTNFNNPQDVGTDLRIGVVQVDYELSDLLLTSISGYISSDLFLRGDIDGSSRDYFNEFGNSENQSISQEFRIQNADESRWQWNLGVLLARDEGASGGQTLVGTERLFGLAEGFRIDWWDSENEADVWAIFGQADYDLTEKLTLSIGGRYSEETKQSDIQSLVGGTIRVLSVEHTFTDFSPRVAATFRANDQLTYYGTVSKGFKSGGVQIAPNAENESYDPETLWNYEVGFKAALVDDRIRLNGAIFYMDWKDLQVGYQENLIDEDGNFVQFNGTDNADSAVSKGAELVATALVSEDLLVDLSIGYLDAEFDKFVALIDGQNRILDGRTIPNSPKWTAAANANYGFNMNDSLDGFLRLEWKYRAEIVPTTSAMIQSGYPWEVPSYDFVNLRAGLVHEDFKVVAYAENLFDSVYYTNAYNKAFAGGLFIEPSFRTYGVRFTYEYGAE